MTMYILGFNVNRGSATYNKYILAKLLAPLYLTINRMLNLKLNIRWIYFVVFVV